MKIIYSNIDRQMQTNKLASLLRSGMIVNERNPETQSKRMWTTKDVAEYLRFSEDAIREATARGDIKGHKFPPNSTRGEWRYWKTEVDQSMNRKPRHHKTKGASIY